MALALACKQLPRLGAVPVLSSLKRLFSAAAPAPDEVFSVQVKPFLGHKIDPPTPDVQTSVKELMGMYDLMLKMRRLETAIDVLYKSKLIRGFCHLYDGQEAVLAGIESVSSWKDSIITSYRDHCHPITRGGTIKQVLSELMGRKDGVTKGLGGSMHMYGKAANYYGGNGIVGAQIPLGTGLGFAHKYRKDDSVSITMYGDGAANQGQTFEALNMAALWNLPVVFICENNHYGLGTAEWRATKSFNFYTRGDFIPGIKADGMDVLAVKKAVQFAKDYVLKNGPMIVELDTYRYHGHSMSDPGSTYRTREEINAMRTERDPVDRVKKLLLSVGVDPAEVKKVEQAVKREVDEAIEQSKSADVPPNSWLYLNSYKEPTNVSLRTTQGERVSAKFDVTYA